MCDDATRSSDDVLLLPAWLGRAGAAAPERGPADGNLGDADVADTPGDGPVCPDGDAGAGVAGGRAGTGWRGGDGLCGGLLPDRAGDGGLDGGDHPTDGGCREDPPALPRGLCARRDRAHAAVVRADRAVPAQHVDQYRGRGSGLGGVRGADLPRGARAAENAGPQQVAHDGELRAHRRRDRVVHAARGDGARHEHRDRSALRRGATVHPLRVRVRT